MYFKELLVVYLGDREFQLADGVRAIPLARVSAQGV